MASPSQIARTEYWRMFLRATIASTSTLSATISATTTSTLCGGNWWTRFSSSGRLFSKGPDMHCERSKYFVITVDDPGALVRDLGIFQNTLDFFAHEEVEATYFVVPQGADGEWRVDRNREWVHALREAGQRGHDFQLHGLDHGHCEFGAHPALMSIMGGADYAARLKKDIEQCGHLWTRELFVA
ncbi:MAG: hypothetical protein COZ56_20405, partial [Armatimonadetes bacterium CG_4_8_14_3_um_filter_58_9]